LCRRATGRRGGVSAERSKLWWEFKWRLSPESRYAAGGLVARSSFRTLHSALETALFLYSFWDERLGQLAFEFNYRQVESVLTVNSEMSNSHDNHYVPQMHLKRFAMPGSPRKIVVYDKEWKTEAGDKSLKGQAYERDLYTMNPGEPDENTVIEDGILKQIDNDASVALDKLLGGILDSRGRTTLAFYISSLIMRNPKFIEKRRQDMSREGVEIYRRIYLYDPEFKNSLRQKFSTDEEFQEAWKASAPEHVTITGNKTAAMAISVHIIEKIAEEIFKLPWTILSASSDDRFIIADDPVFCCNPIAKARSPVGLLTRGAETILPISSNACLVIAATGSDAYKLQVATSWQVNEINTRSAYTATRRFFGSAINADWSKLMERFDKWDGKVDFYQAPNLDVSIQAVDNHLFRPLFA